MTKNLLTCLAPISVALFLILSFPNVLFSFNNEVSEILGTYCRSNGPKALLHELYVYILSSKNSIEDKNNVIKYLFDSLSKNNKPKNLSNPSRLIAELNNFFKTTTDINLTKEQQLFLGWHLAPENFMYEHNLNDPSGDAVVGWDNYIECLENGDRRLFTFGLMGCTALVAIAPTCEMLLSHYAGVDNAKQVRIAMHFLKRFPESRFYCIGPCAASLATVLRSRGVDNPISVHIKTPYYKTSYSVMLYRQEQQVTIWHSENPLDLTRPRLPVWLDSLQGEAYQMGDASWIYPDTPFVRTAFMDWPQW